MAILIAPDSFKDSLSAQEVSKAIANGIKAYDPSIPCHYLAASDGGEGFLEAIKNHATGLQDIKVSTVDPLGRSIDSNYLLQESECVAYIELAKASGLELLSIKERNPLFTSTYGTGIQIKNAIARGAQKIYLGLGGSATNDGGIGIAQALGYQFLDNKGALLKPMGKSLNAIQEIQKPKDLFSEISFYAVNDVSNPLFGTTGAAHTYAKQKGASKEDIASLDLGLKNLDEQVKEYLGLSNAMTPGAGAAGGTAYGLATFFNASFIPGASFLLEIAQFEALLKNFNISLIITGEGKMDHQTAYGKFAYGILQEAIKLGVPVLGICGKLELSLAEIHDFGFLEVAEIYQRDKPKQYSFDHARSLITQVTEQLLEKYGSSLF